MIGDYNMEKKRKQHYVFRYYLTPWANPRVYCLQKNVVFPAHLENLANQRDFYRLKELTTQEELFIKMAFIDRAPNSRLKKIFIEMLDLFTGPFKKRKELESKDILTEELDKKIDQLINNVEEEYHAHIESVLIPFLKKLNHIDGDFTLTRKEFNDLNFVICVQYFRTKRNRSYVVKDVNQKLGNNPQMKILAEIYGFNIENMYQIIANFLAVSLADSLNSQHNQYHYVILKNDTLIPLISGDQPVLNTKADYQSGISPTEFEMYYPISPTKAVLLTKENNFKSIKNYTLSVDEVHHYNNCIFKASENQLFANEENVLHKYKSNMSCKE